MIASSKNILTKLISHQKHKAFYSKFIDIEKTILGNLENQTQIIDIKGIFSKIKTKKDEIAIWNHNDNQNLKTQGVYSTNKNVQTCLFSFDDKHAYSIILEKAKSQDIGNNMITSNIQQSLSIPFCTQNTFNGQINSYYSLYKNYLESD